MTGEYSNPAKKCDMVMKGGITSGVVYPLAICELAKKYTFKNLGGTSAGAIAAAAAAAAEYGRQNKKDDDDNSGFEKLAILPDLLGENLFSLFQPQAPLKVVFNTLIAGFSGAKGNRIWINVMFASIKNFPVSAVIGMFPGVVLAVLALTSARGVFLIWSLLSALLLLLVGIISGITISFGRRALKEIPGNFFGLCSGMPSSSANALTPWLAKYLDELAGVADREKPLTFGDLWGEKKERNINLEMLTTNITTGQSFRLPFNTRIFSFAPKEFEQLFPKKVVDWMKANPADNSDDPSEDTAYLPMPEAKDLPVVVATRLSLSFPILLSAIPLYAVDYNRVRNHPNERKLLRRCWFSDGGIVSNIPIHFFDKPLPRWPTFAIDLQDTDTENMDNTDQTKNVWTPTRNIGGIVPVWHHLGNPENGNNSGSIIGFLGLIISTMQNWLDNAQMQVPGYRDRVVHIMLNPDKEGGLNLKMSPEEINILSERGKAAGMEFVKRFGSDNPVETPKGESSDGWIEYPWENHRWLRFRSVMSLLEEFLKDFGDTYNSPEHGDKPFGQLIKKTDPGSYEWERKSQKTFAEKIIKQLLITIDAWNNEKQNFKEGAPSPSPVLKISPRT
jgi:predicted acylesterase/phospholipase RssA